jgi:hypothetical protein
MSPQTRHRRFAKSAAVNGCFFFQKTHHEILQGIIENARSERRALICVL